MIKIIVFSCFSTPPPLPGGRRGPSRGPRAPGAPLGAAAPPPPPPAAGADVTGLDRDPEAIEAARARLARFAREGRFHALRGNFADVDAIPALGGAAFDG